MVYIIFEYFTIYTILQSRAGGPVNRINNEKISIDYTLIIALKSHGLFFMDVNNRLLVFYRIIIYTRVQRLHW